MLFFPFVPSLVLGFFFFFSIQCMENLSGGRLDLDCDVKPLMFSFHYLMQILEWKDIGVANLPGVISLFAGLLMWVTSFAPVRQLNFELFFYTHQLYVIFVVFLALHVGDFLFAIAAGGIFIFLLDRFLRFCQSRRVVDIISAKCLPCGTVELVLAKPESKNSSSHD